METNDVKTKYEVPDSLVLPGMSQEVRRGVAVLTHEDVVIRRTAQFQDKPYRSCGDVSLLTMADFVAFVTERKECSPVVYVSQNYVEACFNDDGWRDDLCRFCLSFTPEWEMWKKYSDVLMSQAVFCDFLEDHQKEIVNPKGSELLELVANFRQLMRVDYESSYRGAGGQIMLGYRERKEGAGGRDMALPGEFLMHLPVIKGAEQMTTYEVKARLRARVNEESKKLGLQYVLVRPDVPEDNAIKDIVEYLRTALPGAKVFAGKLGTKPMSILT